jgi:hypothetical protein
MILIRLIQTTGMVRFPDRNLSCSEVTIRFHPNEVKFGINNHSLSPNAGSIFVPDL